MSYILAGKGFEYNDDAFFLPLKVTICALVQLLYFEIFELKVQAFQNLSLTFMKQ
jgi:hypothetical protein